MLYAARLDLALASPANTDAQCQSLLANNHNAMYLKEQCLFCLQACHGLTHTLRTTDPEPKERLQARLLDVKLRHALARNHLRRRPLTLLCVSACQGFGTAVRLREEGAHFGIRSTHWTGKIQGQRQGQDTTCQENSLTGRCCHGSASGTKPYRSSHVYKRAAGHATSNVFRKQVLPTSSSTHGASVQNQLQSATKLKTKGGAADIRCESAYNACANNHLVEDTALASWKRTCPNQDS